MDVALASLHGRVDAYAGLPIATYPRAKDAISLLAKLFPTGLAFLRLPYAEEWAEVRTLLQVVDEGDLAMSLDGVCGKEFLENVRTAFEAYGVALALTRRSQAPTELTLGEPLRALARAIASYGVQLVAFADDGAHPEVLREALRPLDSHREAMNRRGRAGSTGNDTSTPEENPSVSTSPVPPTGSGAS